MISDAPGADPVDHGADEDWQRGGDESTDDLPAVDPDAPGRSLFTTGEDDVEPNEPA